MISQLQEAIEDLPGSHPMQLLSQWHLGQIVRQIRLRSRDAMIPPYSKIEQYRGQGRLLSKLYTVLLLQNKRKLVHFLDTLTIEDTRKLLWQRFTASSLTGTEYLLARPDTVFGMIRQNDRPQALITSAHCSCGLNYWDMVKELAVDKSRESGRSVMIEVADFYLDNYTWWNTYKSEDTVVLEYRDRTGHGIRFDFSTKDLMAMIEPNEEGVIFSTER